MQTKAQRVAELKDPPQKTSQNKEVQKWRFSKQFLRDNAIKTQRRKSFLGKKKKR